MEVNELYNELYKLTREVYNKEYHEIFGFIDYTIEELRQQLEFLKRKKESLKTDSEKSEFLQIWKRFWGYHLQGQEVLCELYGLVAISQLLKHIKLYRGFEEDLRLHLCVIAPSGTGKSDANNLLAEFAKLANLKYYAVDRYNDAILTGSINKQAIDYNIKHKLKPDDERYIDPHVSSILEINDFIVYDEGENILKTTTATEGAQRILQKAMNRHGSEGNKITNTLVGHKVECYPNCSIIITSYYLNEFKQTLLYRGLLQRMIIYIQDEDEQLRETIIKRIINDIPTKANVIEDKLSELEKIKKELKDEILRLRRKHKETKFVYITDEAKETLLQGLNELRTIMPFLLGQKAIWESMVSRLTINLLKVSALYALLDYKQVIEREHANKAINILIKAMETVAFFLKQNIRTELDEKAIKIYKSLKRKFIGQKKSEDDWVEILIKNYGFTKEKAKLFIKTLIDNEKMRTKIIVNEKILMLR